jgi:hypothetical protein
MAVIATIAFLIVIRRDDASRAEHVHTEGEIHSPEERAR